MRKLDEKQYLKNAEHAKIYVITLLKKQGYVTFAKRLELIKFVVADFYKGIRVEVAFMIDTDAVIAVNPAFLDTQETADQLSMIVRHELLHFMLMHERRFARHLAEKYPNIYRNYGINQIANIAMDYEISRYYSPEDKQVAKNLKIGQEIIQGLVQELDEPSFNGMDMETMFDELEKRRQEQKGANPDEPDITIKEISHSAEYTDVYNRTISTFENEKLKTLEDLYGRASAGEDVLDNSSNMSSEKRQAIIDALKAIMETQLSGGMPPGMGGSNQTVELDPNLALPKSANTNSASDLNISDPDHVLDKMRQNNQNRQNQAQSGQSGQSKSRASQNTADDQSEQSGSGQDSGTAEGESNSNSSTSSGSQSSQSNQSGQEDSAKQETSDSKANNQSSSSSSAEGQAGSASSTGRQSSRDSKDEKDDVSQLSAEDRMQKLNSLERAAGWNAIMNKYKGRKLTKADINELTQLYNEINHSLEYEL